MEQLSPRFESENVFYSIVRDRNAFGLFRSSEGNLQIGWALHEDAPMDWKQADWPDILASASPPWLAEHIRTHAETIERPILLSVVVGRCPRWDASGLGTEKPFVYTSGIWVMRVSGERARQLLNWVPSAPSVLEELSNGSYRQAAIAA